MGNKRAMLEQITSAKTSQRYPPKFLLPNAFWSGPPIAWSYDSNFRAVSHTPGKGKMILGWQILTAAHNAYPVRQGQHPGEATPASRPELATNSYTSWAVITGW